MVGIEIWITGAAGGRGPAETGACGGGVTGMLGMGILRGNPAIGDGLLGLGATGRPGGIAAGWSGMEMPYILGPSRSMSFSVGVAVRIGRLAAG
jgi:hypothetical protein